MVRGGASGYAAVVPGNAVESQLFSAIKRLDPETAMPPKNAERLSNEEINIIEHWINNGAPWPTGEQKEDILNDPRWKGKGKVTLPIRGGLAESWTNRSYKREDLWAYQPVAEVDVPKNVHPVDHFIEQKLQTKKLQGSSEATRSELIKRIYFDLTGLPPSFGEVQRFAQPNSDIKVEDLIDTLLNDQAYGEQMARIWLDVVRYADSDGFSNDYVRPNAWRYRDYVVRSFNQDKPYDQFVREQIAGDELDPDDPEMLIATGYLRMGPWEHTGMSVAKETRQLFLDDVVNNIGETFLSTPLMCAKCHDHKFDPVPSVDYYAIQAVFATTQFAERPAPFLPDENTYGIGEEKSRIERWIALTKKEQSIIVDKEERAAKRWFSARGKPYLPKKERRKLSQDQQPPRYYGLDYDDLGYRKVLQKRLQVLNKLKLRFEPLAYSVYNGEDRIHHSSRVFDLPEHTGDSLAKTYLLNNGSIFSPGPEVFPGILQAVPAAFKVDNPEQTVAALDLEISPNKMGRRQKLAEWITQPDHPITARSIVNRIWQMHFGKGLVEDPNNFGVNAKKPSHPELLNWLTTYFIKNNWSLKLLHRKIMTSDTYQRSCASENTNQEIVDPDNNWLAHFSPRRLEAEEVRDAILKITNELNYDKGGIPVRPEINMEVALQPRHIMGSIAQAYQPSRTAAERNRRTIYAERIRSLDDPFLNVFNKPRSENSCGRRSHSVVTPQVYALYNSEQMRSRALALAVDITQNNSKLETQIKQAIQRIWLRAPTHQDMEEALAYIIKMTEHHRHTQIPRRNFPVKVKRKMFEEMTGEPFEYTELLDIFENYQADQQYSDVIPQTRALADFCLLLFNSNEFIYVY